MSFREESEMHRKRRSQNIGVAVCLVLFMGLTVALTMVKLRSTGVNEGFDHVLRPAMIEGNS